MKIKNENPSFTRIRENISKIINDKLAKNNISQATLAIACSVSKSTVQKWCSGTCPTADKIPVICETLNINIYELLGIDNPYDLSEDDIKLLEKIKANPTLKDVVERY